MSVITTFGNYSIALARGAASRVGLLPKSGKGKRLLIACGRMLRGLGRASLCLSVGLSVCISRCHMDLADHVGLLFMLDIPDRSTSSPTQLTSDMPCTPVPSGSSSALKLLVLSVVSSYAFGLAYEHAAAYYVELSRSNALLVWTKYPMPLIALVPGVVWSACRAVAFVALGVYVAYSLVLGSIAASYDRLMKGNHFDIDGYFEKATGKRPSTQDKAKCAFIHRMNVGDAPISAAPMALAETLSPFVEGLRVTSRKDGPGGAPLAPGATPFAPPASGAIVVGTIRMGFGHHRIAYAASSWALGSGKATYFHDLLNIDSKEASLIKDMDKLYSAGSRIATEMGGVGERLWGNMSAKQGDENSLRIFYAMAEQVALTRI